MMKKRIIPIILLFAAMWMTAVSASAATVFSDGAFMSKSDIRSVSLPETLSPMFRK